MSCVTFLVQCLMWQATFQNGFYAEDGIEDGLLRESLTYFSLSFLQSLTEQPFFVGTGRGSERKTLFSS